MTSEKFIEILNRIPRKLRSFNRISMSISAYLDDIINARFKNQKEFADLMGKKESEVSKWLSGKHNFTIKSIAGIEAKLDVQILFTPIDIAEMEESFYNKKEVPHIEESIDLGYKGTINFLMSKKNENFDSLQSDLGNDDKSKSRKISFTSSDGTTKSYLRLITISGHDVVINKDEAA